MIRFTTRRPGEFVSALRDEPETLVVGETIDVCDVVRLPTALGGHVERVRIRKRETCVRCSRSAAHLQLETCCVCECVVCDFVWYRLTGQRQQLPLDDV